MYVHVFFFLIRVAAVWQIVPRTWRRLCRLDVADSIITKSRLYHIVSHQCQKRNATDVSLSNVQIVSLSSFFLSFFVLSSYISAQIFRQLSDRTRAVCLCSKSPLWKKRRKRNMKSKKNRWTRMNTLTKKAGRVIFSCWQRHQLSLKIPGGKNAEKCIFCYSSTCHVSHPHSLSPPYRAGRAARKLRRNRQIRFPRYLRFATQLSEAKHRDGLTAS